MTEESAEFVQNSNKDANYKDVSDTDLVSLLF